MHVLAYLVILLYLLISLLILKTFSFVTGICWGDPHFRTLDNQNFTFNGLGEYTILQVRTENVTFDLQGRTSRPVRDDGTLSTATVFSAFAAKEGPTGGTVHFELNDNKSGMTNTLCNLFKCSFYY